jgi:hypothetical protein
VVVLLLVLRIVMMMMMIIWKNTHLLQLQEMSDIEVLSITGHEGSERRGEEV